MKILVNGAPFEAEEGSDLLSLLKQLEQPLEAVAVALNLEVVPRGRCGGRLLQDGDRVEVVRAVGGG